MRDKEKFVGMRISPEAKDTIDETFEQMGMKQKEGMSRLATWFAELDEETRYAILGPESLRPQIARLVLARMTKLEHDEPEKQNGKQ